MEEYNIAVIRVLTLEDTEKLNLHGRLIEKYFPNLKTTSYSIPDQYDGVYNDKSYGEATMKIIELSKKLESKYDGIIISCAGDPGVNYLKKELNIPVVGAGHSVATYSLNFGDRIGVLGITDDAPVPIKNILKDNMIVSIKPSAVNNTNDLSEDLYQNIVSEVSSKIINEKINTIALACTGLSTIGITKYLNDKLQIPIIDPVYSEALIMNGMCNYKKILKG